MAQGTNGDIEALGGGEAGPGECAVCTLSPICPVGLPLPLSLCFSLHLSLGVPLLCPPASSLCLCLSLPSLCPSQLGRMGWQQWAGAARAQCPFLLGPPRICGCASFIWGCSCPLSSGFRTRDRD